VSLTGTKKKNKNAFKKVYPYVRRRPVYTYELEHETIIETAVIEFIAESEKVYVYEGIFAVDPTVTAIAAENSSGDNANVNLVVSNVSTTSCTISASDEFTGYAHVQIILVMS
jgi:hypothetical protein